MIKIIIGNSYSQIVGLSPQDEASLRKALSYDTSSSAAFFSGSFKSRSKSLLDKRGFFPTGLLHRVRAHIKKDMQTIDNRVAPRPSAVGSLKDLPHTPSLPQKQALAAAIRTPRGMIVMPTGSGKSLVIQMITSYFRSPTLVVVPTIGIRDQLSAQLKSNKLVKVRNVDDPKLLTDTDYATLVIDETHHVAAKTYQKLNKTAWTGIYRRYCLTATGFRNNPEETLLFEAIAGELIYELTYKEAVQQKLICPVEAYYIEVPKQECDHETYAKVYSQLVVNNEVRNAMVASVLKNLSDGGLSTLCLVKEVAHGEKIAARSGNEMVSSLEDSRSQYIAEFNQEHRRALVSTTGLLGEGVDTKSCDAVIIAGLGKAKSIFMQQVGRAVRRNGDKQSAIVIIIKDRSHKFTMRHYNAQVKILKEVYGVVPRKLEV